MKTRTKMLLDASVAEPVAWGFNLAARALSKVITRDHAVVADNVRTIVVVKLLGMGSIIQATPLLRTLKTRFPNARLVFLTTAGHKDLVERLECIDEALYIDDRSLRSLVTCTASAVLRLLRGRIDLYFDLEVYSAATSVIGLVSLARNRYGFYRYTARFKRGIFTHLVYFNVRMPVSRTYLQLDLAAGGTAQEIENFGPLTIRESDTSESRAKLTRAGLPEDAPYIVINPNASDLLLERRWPMEYFALAIHELAARGYRSVLVGARSEAAYVSQLLAGVPERSRPLVTNMAGQLSLGELLAVVAKSSCVITNDTGPMHVAFALDRPTVCLFGPSDPETYAIARPGVEILYHRVFCSPCAHELDDPPCAGNNVCMQLIRPEEVVARVLKLLSHDQRETGRQRTSLPVINGATTYVDELGRGLGIAARSSIANAR
jgi:ADP-heptose:LPS heptosyltransferase